MNVLSLFDGMSCGQIALKELGIKVDKYYASEIDKHAIKQTQLNFPATIQLGDVKAWKDWDIDWSSIDLILAGFCCQSFSFAGKCIAFEDPRGKLFFVLVEILNHCKRENPNVKFLVENVRMQYKNLQVISEMVRVYPVLINSALVSAQNRKRNYWSNINTRPAGIFGESYTDIPQPEDVGILVNDILETEVDEKYYLSDKMVTFLYKHSEKMGYQIAIVNERDKSRCLTVCSLVKQNAEANYVMDGGRMRRLTPIECSRLQTIPDWYIWDCSDTQRYSMLGNGWTVEVIKHILKFLN